MTSLLAAFRRHSIGVDVVYIPADAGTGPPTPPLNLTGYDVILAPTLWVVPDAVAEALSAYVSRGGCLLLTMRSGSKNADNQYTSRPLPGTLSPLAGIITNEASQTQPRVVCQVGCALW
jgi:beta-galactosidase GanA